MKTLRSMDVGSVLFGMSLIVLFIAIYSLSAGITKKHIQAGTEIDQMQMEIQILNERVDALEKRSTAPNHQVLEKIMSIMIQNMQDKNDRALDK